MICGTKKLLSTCIKGWESQIKNALERIPHHLSQKPSIHHVKRDRNLALQLLEAQTLASWRKNLLRLIHKAKRTFV
ncbi:MAG: hypothetical protein ACJAQ5_001792 [Flavobacteriales bacterium]|jgi:hypothetical protein